MRAKAETLSLGYLHEHSVGLFLVDLVAHVVDVRREVVLRVIVDDVADVWENELLKDSVLQVFQKPTKTQALLFFF